MGSQRLTRKNLRELGGVSLVARAIRKCHHAGCFDAVWLNSEHPEFRAIAESEGAKFHQRPEHLGSATATSEDYIAEFLETHECDWLVQVHSIAPLATAADLWGFVNALETLQADCLLSVEAIKLECAMNGRPVNFN